MGEIVKARPDTVLDLESKVLHQGTTNDTVLWLEWRGSVELLWVSIGETGDLITASEYLDLATDNTDRWTEFSGIEQIWIL